MAQSDWLTHLRHLNNLLAELDPAAEDLPEQFAQALNYYRDQFRSGSAEALSPSDFARSAATLVRLHRTLGKPGEGSIHLHVFDPFPAVDVGDLWLRQAFLAKMRELVGYPCSLLIIPGLRGHARASGRGRKRRESAILANRVWMESVAVQWHQGQRVCQLLFVG